MFEQLYIIDSYQLLQYAKCCTHRPTPPGSTPPRRFSTPSSAIKLSNVNNLWNRIWGGGDSTYKVARFGNTSEIKANSLRNTMHHLLFLHGTVNPCTRCISFTGYLKQIWTNLEKRNVGM